MSSIKLTAYAIVAVLITFPHHSIADDESSKPQKHYGDRRLVIEENMQQRDRSGDEKRKRHHHPATIQTIQIHMTMKTKQIGKMLVKNDAKSANNPDELTCVLALPSSAVGLGFLGLIGFFA